MTVRPDWHLRQRVVACALILTAAMAPSVTVQRPVMDVVAVLDITGSMNVRDQRLDGVAVSRIAMEKRSVRRLAQALPCGSRLGLAVFVEAQPFLLFQPIEICENHAPLDQEISAIDWRMGWDSESHIAESLRAAVKMAMGVRADLIFMTDGQETPPLWWSRPVALADIRDGVHGVVVGVGGRDLVAIPKYDAAGREIGVFQPGDVPLEHEGLFRGREHLSAVDEPHLRALASQTGLAYVHLDDEDGLLRALSSVATRRRLPTRLSLSPVFALGALMLLVPWTASSSFLKERTKNFLSIQSATARRKVFCFFFSKKKALPLRP